MTQPTPANVFLPRLEMLERSEIRDIQLRKLQRQLAKMHSSNPFYREKWPAAGFHPDQVKTLEDIRRVPFTNKQDFLADQLAYPPFGQRLGVPLEQVGEITESSGTSGNRKELHGHTVQDMHLRGQLTGLGWAWAGLRKDDIGVFHIPASNSASLYTMLRGIRSVGRLPYLVGHLGFEERIELMRSIGVNGMYMTPSGLNGLAVLCENMGLKPAEIFPDLRFVMVSAESWPVEWVQRMEAIWNAKITEVYGSTQLNAAYGASCCERGAVIDGQRGRQHFFEWAYLYEVIDPETLEPTPAGEPGELVVTHLDKQASTIIRYRTGDRVVWGPHNMCPCGRQLMTMEAGVIGRVDDTFKVKGQSIFPSEVDSVIFANAEVDEFQARAFIGEKGRDEIELRFAIKDVYEGADPVGLTTKLVRDLKQATDVTFRVMHVASEELPHFTSPDKKARRWTDDRHTGLARPAKSSAEGAT